MWKVCREAVAAYRKAPELFVPAQEPYYAEGARGGLHAAEALLNKLRK